MVKKDNSDFKIHVLVIDRDREITAMLCNILSKSGLCIPQQVDTVAHAQKRIECRDEPVDICILEVFDDCVNEDALEFVKNNARVVPCIVLTQSESAALGARCCEAGAKKVVDKKELDKKGVVKKEFVKEVYDVACLHMINPDYTAKGTDTFDNATGILYDKCPESVTEWAELTGISDRQLRGLVKKKSKLGAKQALALAKRLHK